MPTAAPTAASTPAAENLKDAKAPFDLGLDVLEAELLPVLVPVLLPLLPLCAVEVPAGEEVEVGYAAPKALTSNCCETA